MSLLTLNEAPPFPDVIDNTMRSTFVSCPRKFFYEFLNFLVTKGFKNAHLHGGASFADALDVYRTVVYQHKRSHDEGVVEAFYRFVQVYGYDESLESSDRWKESNKSFDIVSSALIDYLHTYSIDNTKIHPYVFPTGDVCTEKSFCLPIDVKHPVTGNPILFHGRFDMIAEMKGRDGLFVVDEKTTKSLSSQWAKQWDLRAQFTGYAWGAKHFEEFLGRPIIGTIVRGIGLQKTQIQHKEVITYRKQWEIDRWYEQLCRDVQRMVASWEQSYYDYNLSESCSSYGGCTFMQLCTVQNPATWVNANFERMRWDPRIAERKPCDENGLFIES